MGDDVLRVDWMRPAPWWRGVEPHRVLAVVLAPFVVRQLSERLLPGMGPWGDVDWLDREISLEV